MLWPQLAHLKKELKKLVPSKGELGSPTLYLAPREGKHGQAVLLTSETALWELANESPESTGALVESASALWRASGWPS